LNSLSQLVSLLRKSVQELVVKLKLALVGERKLVDPAIHEDLSHFLGGAPGNLVHILEFLSVIPTGLNSLGFRLEDEVLLNLAKLSCSAFCVRNIQQEPVACDLSTDTGKVVLKRNQTS